MKRGDWICPDCGDHCFASKNTCRCGKWRPKPTQQLKPGDWNCSCGELNFSSRLTCRKCNNEKTRSIQPQPRTGDWNCACGELNFASRLNCRKCNLGKPIAGVGTVQSPQVKPGDWKCSCAEINFGTRIICRKCGSSRPSTESSGKCAVCFENDANVCLKNCGHIAICFSCAEVMNLCPICRKPYTSNDIIKTFIVV